jgi:membrane-associated protease RseP (regulator of RpoE activity)
VSDETTPTPETPEAPTPAAPTPAPEATAAPDAPVPPPPVAESPTEPAAAGPAAATERTGNYVAVPRWLLVTVAAVVAAALMFGIGYTVGDRVGDDDDDRASTSMPYDDDDMPRFPGQGQGNQTMPQVPGRGQGNPTTPQLPGQGQGGTPSRTGAFLGVATQPVTGGLGITQVVANSAAADAGLQVGDVIVSFDGTAVSTPAQLAAAVASLRPGDEVRVAYTRNDANRTVTVELGTRPTTNN